MFKKIFLPVLGLFILGTVSYAQFSWKHVSTVAQICEFPDGETLELFEVAQKYINQPDKVIYIKKCCEAHKNCRMHTMTDGNNLLHVAAYYGNADLVKYLKTERGFDKVEYWQDPEIGGRVKYRTEVMYAAAQNKEAAVEKLVELGSSAKSVSAVDGKTAYTLTTDEKIKDFLAPFISDAGGLKNMYQNAAQKFINYTWKDENARNEAIAIVESQPIWQGLHKYLLNVGNQG